ncbi:hypothetical protein GQ457_HM001300 [Hibiscus cannabinus]
MTGFIVNVGEILANELAAHCKNDKGILAFPCLISALCRRFNTPMFDTDKYKAEKIGWTRAVYMRKMNVADAEPLNMAMPTPPASPVHEADARVEDSAPPSPAEPSAAAEQNRTPPPSPPIIPVSSHTTTTSPATTPAAPTERSRGRTPETPLRYTPSNSSPPPLAPAQSDEVGSLQYMLLTSQLQRIEARQLHFQSEVKVFQETLTKFLIFQFPASTAFFGGTSTPPPQPSASAAAAAQPSTHTSAKEGATEEVHFSSEDENDIFDWQSPRDHMLALGPSTSTPAPAAPILSAAPTPTTAAAVERPTPDSPARKKGKATVGRTFDRGNTSSPDEEEADQRPAKRRRKYHVIIPESDEDDSDAEVQNNPQGPILPLVSEIDRLFHQRRREHRANTTMHRGDEPVDGQQHQPDGGNAGALARPRAIRDHLTPILDDLNPGIVAPEIQAAHFELKPVMFNMLNSIGQFGGSPHEDARQHIRAFLEVCDSFRQQGVHEDVLKLKLFPYSLRDRARGWLSGVPAGSLKSWADLCRSFLMRVEFTTKAINKFFAIKIWADLHTPFVNGMKDQNIDFLLENLCFQGAEWDEGNTTVERDRLKPAAKLWMHFLKINLMPTTHTATVNLPRLQLLHSILNSRSINLGQLIVDEAFAGISWKQSPLLFPRLITALCRQQGVMEDENDFFIRGRQGIKPSQIPSLMGFDEDATASAPPGGARTIAAARMAELMALTERTQDQLRDMQEKMTSLFHYMRERDEAIQSYFLELLPDEVPLFPIFPNELFHAAQPAKRRAPQDQATPQPPLKKKKVPSTSTATPPVRPPAQEEHTEPATPHADTAASVPKPPAKTATASKRTLTRKDKGKAPVRASPRAPAPEATVELDSDDDHDDDMPDAPPPPAPPMEPTIPRRRLKRKANRNISTADLAAEENIASEAEDDESSTTPEETPNPNPPSSKARYKRVATKQTPK